jgi:NAD(P)-dependent dehydrogenase (short-subunit alcohol dehydrogenase family)
VKQLVVQGHKVVFCDVNDQAGMATEKEIDIAKFIQADVTRADDWKNVVQAAKELYGSIEALVNNAGTALPLNQDPATVDNDAFMRALKSAT